MGYLIIRGAMMTRFHSDSCGMDDCTSREISSAVRDELTGFITHMNDIFDSSEDKPNPLNVLALDCFRETLLHELEEGNYFTSPYFRGEGIPESEWTQVFFTIVKEYLRDILGANETTMSFFHSVLAMALSKIIRKELESMDGNTEDREMKQSESTQDVSGNIPRDSDDLPF